MKPAASSSLSDKGSGESASQSHDSGAQSSSELVIEEHQPASGYEATIKKYSQRYNIDWILVLAVMKQESRFNSEATSHRGAYGLMQIMPVTQTELIDKLGVSDASSPRNNIRAGIYHLKSLFRSFSNAKGQDRVQLALAAYNGGLQRVMAAREVARYFGEDPNKWESVRNKLPLLSRRYYTLHKSIWGEDKPPCGYFAGWRETTTYVQNIMQFYDQYSLALK
jgi:membrane-bound lytic murein transglycosylase F